MTLADLEVAGLLAERHEQLLRQAPVDEDADAVAAVTREERDLAELQLRRRVVASGRSSESSVTKTGSSSPTCRPVRHLALRQQDRVGRASGRRRRLASGRRVVDEPRARRGHAVDAQVDGTAEQMRRRGGAAAASGIGSMPGAVPVSTSRHARSPTPSRSTSTPRSRDFAAHGWARLGRVLSDDGLRRARRARRRSHAARACATTGSSSSATRRPGATRTSSSPRAGRGRRPTTARSRSSSSTRSSAPG